MDFLNCKKLRIALKAYESKILDDSCQQIIDIVNKEETKIVGPIPLPTKRRIYCVLRSPHVNKDAREHFEIRTHKRIIDVYSPNSDVLQNLRSLDISAGVDVEVKNF
jgi:small subunit ribosomal protein S10